MDKLIYDHIVVRYGELSTKGKNIKDFKRKLHDNLKSRLSSFSNLKFETLHDGIFIKLNGEEYDEVANALRDVYGYSYFSGCFIIEKDLDKACELSLKIAKKKEYKTFKVITKRLDKNYPLRSDEINRKIAAHILKNHEIKVDVHDPELSIYVYIQNDSILIMDDKQKGLGGFPVGINGTALVMMSGGIDSPVAAFKTMQRGLRIECIHFASQPYTSVQALNKVKDLIKVLSVHQGTIRLHIIPFTDLQVAIYDHCGQSYAITIMRRMMYRIADAIAKQNKMVAITNGESVGQVASQTPESLNVISKVCDTLILRPLCMEDKIEIVNLAKKLNTYDISILPYEDCCTIFDPKNPVTKPKEKQCLLLESKFDYNKLVEDCIKNEEIVNISYRNKEEDIF